MPGLHLRTLKLDPRIAFASQTWKSMERRGMCFFCGQILFFALKQVLKNARASCSAGLGQLSSCVADTENGDNLRVPLE